MAGNITTEQDFLEQVAGKRLVDGNSWVIINPDGTVEGVGPDQQPVSGSWSWSETFYRRSIHFDGKDLPEDLQVVSIDGDRVSFAHQRGAGETITWSIG